ncbi:putative major facilitator superfamily, MFS transporter superfamily [Septoria linicola]|nr:putative major facilitator superfamily, MFS transporter superfamily [Septoria linicola]
MGNPSLEGTSRTSSNDRNAIPKIFPEAIITEPTVFKRTGGKTFEETESLEDFYQPIAEYEGRHRYDPKFQWDAKQERRVVRRIDARICTWACLMFFALQLDRGNISQALSDNLLDDLGMTTNQYNTGQTIFYVCFLFAELPSQLISKAIGPDNWIPIQMVSWSLVACMQAFLSGKSSFWATRALLGLIEGGFIPDVILYLSIVSAFLADGILHMRGINGMAGWRWLFALEGLLTGLIGLVSYFYLPPSPTETASWFRGKAGWFTVDGEKIMVNRVLRDDPSKGDMHNREGLSITMLWKCLKDFHMWPVYLLGLSWMIPNIPITSCLTLQLKNAGFGTFETNLRTIPAYMIFIINLLAFTWLTKKKLNERFILATISQIWCLPLLVALEVLPADRSPWVAWILSVLLYAMPYVHATIVAVTSRNAGSVRTRTVASAIYNMTVQTSNIIGNNVYRTADAPQYYTGNKVLLALVAYNICLFVFAKCFYVTVNRRRGEGLGRHVEGGKGTLPIDHERRRQQASGLQICSLNIATRQL